jgi:hypothetical protein
MEVLQWKIISCCKHLHNYIIPLRGKIWAHKISLTLPLFIEVPVPSQGSKQVIYVCYGY